MLFLAALLLAACEWLAESLRDAAPTLPAAFAPVRLTDDLFLDPPQEPDWRETLSDEIDATTSRRAYTIPLRWSSFSYWRGKAFDGRYIHVDAEGYRRTVNVPLGDKADAAPLVLLYGGSTMWGQGARDEHTIASELSRALAAAGHPARVVNHAQVGFVHAQERIELERDLATGLRPQAVVFLDGFNDCFAALFSGAAGGSMAEEARRMEFNLSKRRPSELFSLAFSRLEVVRVARDWLPREPAAPTPTRPLNEVVSETLDQHLAQIEMAQALGDKFSFQVLCYWQPLVYFRQQKTSAEQSIETPLPALKSFCEVAQQQWATRNPRGLIDLNGLFNEPAWQDRTAFFDHCHLTEPAHRAVAERIAADLIARGLRHPAKPQPATGDGR